MIGLIANMSIMQSLLIIHTSNFFRESFNHYTQTDLQLHNGYCLINHESCRPAVTTEVDVVSGITTYPSLSEMNGNLIMEDITGNSGGHPELDCHSFTFD